MPRGVKPQASAAASPPLEPPGERPASHGLRVGPRSALSVCQRRPKSGIFVRPIGMAPAALSPAMAGASSSGTSPANATTPCVVAEPATSRFSFTVNGTPCKGGSPWPAVSAASAASAAASASSAKTTVRALSAGFTAAIRARCAAITSRLDTALVRIACASSCALARHSSLACILHFNIHAGGVDDDRVSLHPQHTIPGAHAVAQIDLEAMQWAGHDSALQGALAEGAALVGTAVVDRVVGVRHVENGDL